MINFRRKKTKKSVSAVQATASVPLLSDACYNLVAGRGDLGTRMVLRTTRLDLHGH